MAERRIPFTMQRTHSWDPFRDLNHTSRIFDQAFGLPPVFEDFPAFPTTHWPGYMRPSLMGPDIMMPQSHMMYHPGHMMAQQARAMSRQMSSGMSEVKQTPDNWKISLDVPHFSPEELVVKTKDGVLEISETQDIISRRPSPMEGRGVGTDIPLKIKTIDYCGRQMEDEKGKHEERKDEHGFVSRSFTRKYTLPPTANFEKVTSSLSPEGVLTVEAPINKPAIEYSETTIPVNVEKSAAVAKK